MGDAWRDFKHRLIAQRAYAFDRAGHLTWVSRCIALAGLVTGGAVFTQLGATEIGKYILGVVIPIIAAAEVVFEFAKRAERWREIIRETDALLTRLDEIDETDADALLSMRKEYDAIELPSERLFHYAHAISWNVANREMGIDAREVVDGWRAFWRNWLPGRPDISS